MMIEIKSTKAQPQEADPAQRYVLKDAERKSKTPAILGVFLVGIALYLKSIFPGSADPEQEEPSPEKEPDGQGEAKLAQAQLDAHPALDNKPTGTVPEPGAPPGGGRLVDLVPPAEFISVESPALENFRLPDVDEWWKEFQPLDLEALSANDNTDRTTPPGHPNPGGGDPEDPDVVDPTEPEDPDDQETDPPCGEDDGEEPCGEDPTNEPDDEEPCENNPQAGNRAPRVSGPVYLMDVTGCAVLTIALSDLLRNAVDPDGDALAVENLTVSSGSLSQSGDGWIFQSGPQLLGPVTISYEITDGEFTVQQTAHFSVIRSFIGGTDGDDLLLGTMCADDMDGGSGDDNMDGRAGNDVLSGGEGDDHIVAGSGDDIVFAGTGDDIVFGGSGNDHISGGAGNDRLFGDDGDDVIFGDAGHDILAGGDGNDLLSGGDGNDTVAGGSGDDAIDGGSGNDVARAGEGDDTILDGSGDDVVYAEEGDDAIVASADGHDDVYDGGDGLDTIDYSAAAMTVTVDLSGGIASGGDIGEDTVSRFEAVIGGAGDDGLAGTDCADFLQGNDGDDLLRGRRGDDTLSDGQGSDIVHGGGGNDLFVAALDSADDIYDGGSGCDTIDYSASVKSLTIDLTTGTACGVEIGEDSISGFETVVGGHGDDHFVAGREAAVMTGGNGDDLFEFAPAEPVAAINPVIHEIMDFKVGDRIRMSKYDLFEEVLDEMEDRFEDIYGDSFDDDDVPIRVSHDWVEDMKRTVVEADLNRDDIYETTVTMQGHHVLVVVENV